MRTSRLLVPRLLMPLLLVGCDGRDEPLGPQAVDGLAAAQAVVGLYELTVLNGTDLGGGVWQVPSSGGWSLMAHVAFPGGTPVTRGTVLFQQLINGRWDRVAAGVSVNQSGNATHSPGIALPVNVRFKYTGQGSGVKNGVSNTITLMH
jgi:hypothetical protein